MSDRATRRWWPFEVIAEDNRDAEHNAGIDFLTNASRIGFRAYIDGSDFGALSDDGKECRIIWRGRQRRELLLIDNEQCVRKEMFTSSEKGTALAQAATLGLAFLKGGMRNASQVGILDQQSGVGDLDSKFTPTQEAARRQ